MNKKGVYSKIRSILHSLLDIRENESARPRDVVHVSELVGCLRKAYFDRVSPAKSQVANPVALLVGRLVHERFNVIANREGCRTEVQVEREVEGVRLVGKADAVCDGVVLELKVGDVSADYDVAKLQAAIYAWLLNAKEAYVLIIDRQNGLVKLERAPYDPNHVEHVVAKRIRELKHALESRRPPKPDPRFCRFCPYKWRCGRRT